jgi:hypothetical protein
MKIARPRRDKRRRRASRWPVAVVRESGRGCVRWQVGGGRRDRETSEAAGAVNNGG